MPLLNYKHLRYFWTVAKSGSIIRASEQLHVTPQSISGQLTELQVSLGVELFRRAGRGIELTDAGRRILGYAEEIFSLGDELLEALRDTGTANAFPFRIGFSDSVPKSIAYHVVEPLLHLEEPMRVICREGRLVSLLSELSVHRLDMVIADRQMPADVRVKAYNHLLGTSDLTVFGARALMKSLNGDFPECLDGMPFLFPGEGAAIRAALERWFESVGVVPRVVGEFDDGALMKAFGQSGAGLFTAPSAIAGYICKQYGVGVVGRINAVKEEIYVITPERRIRHPATIAVCQAATREVFATAALRGKVAAR